MKTVVSTERIPIKMWLDGLEPSAMSQARNLANLPFAFKHIAIMPDSHTGYGMPIGSVLATKGAIVPNAVGVDIGCGMCAVPTELETLDRKTLKNILKLARERIPLGFNQHETDQDEQWMPEGAEDLKIVSRHYAKARKQVGSLGGGNHFIEIQKGNDGKIWVMIHSGSRNLGYNVAKHYNQLAIKLNERFHSVVDTRLELAFLPLESEEATDYFHEMNYCVEFAFANRRLMMERMLESMEDVVGKFWHGKIINESHNFAAWENHFKENVLVHRKGATRARQGELGMIPGSQGTNSFIVRGRGEKESFQSCSHGAGRAMGRRQAQRELDLQAEIDLLNKKGIVHGIRHKRDLDEATSAYKDINEVMANQTDLVDIMVMLSPMAVLKG